MLYLIFNKLLDYYPCHYQFNNITYNKYNFLINIKSMIYCIKDSNKKRQISSHIINITL